MTASPTDTAVPTEAATPPPADTATPVPTDPATAQPVETATLSPSDTPPPSQPETPTETATPLDPPTVAPEGTETVTPSAPPVVDFAATLLVGSTPLTITFINSSTHTTDFRWDFGDGITQTETISDVLVPPAFVTTTHSYTQSGVYTISLTAIGPGGGQMLTHTNYLTVSEPALAGFSAFPVSGPAPLTVQFFDNSTGGISNYDWDFGDGSTLLTTDGLTKTLISPSHTYTQAGVYTVTLLAANEVSTDTLVKPAYISVTEELAADFSAAPGRGKAPLTVTFSNHSTEAEEYRWDFGDGESSTDVEPTHVYSQAGVYTVTLEASGPEGMDTLVQPAYLTVTEAISVAFAAFPHRAEVPALVQFLNNSSGTIDSYDWDFGDPSTLPSVAGQAMTSTLASPTHTYTAAGVYTVSLTAIATEGTPSTLVKPSYITVTPPVAADFSASPLIGTVPLTVTFTNSSTNALTFEWDFGDNSPSTSRRK